jgi:hypothetical protein
MSKKTVSNEQLIRIKAKYEAKFGISLDMWSAMNLAMLEESSLSILEKIDEASLTVKGASDKIKAEVKQYHFKSKWEAFYHSFGLYSIPSLCAFGIALLIYSYLTTVQTFQEQKRFLASYDKTFIYREIIQFGKIVELDNHKYLVLKNIPEKKPTVTYGKEACYIKKENLIYVPLKSNK